MSSADIYSILLNPAAVGPHHQYYCSSSYQPQHDPNKLFPTSRHRLHTSEMITTANTASPSSYHRTTVLIGGTGTAAIASSSSTTLSSSSSSSFSSSLTSSSVGGGNSSNSVQAPTVAIVSITPQSTLSGGANDSLATKSSATTPCKKMSAAKPSTMSNVVEKLRNLPRRISRAASMRSAIQQQQASSPSWRSNAALAAYGQELSATQPTKFSFVSTTPAVSKKFITENNDDDSTATTSVGGDSRQQQPVAVTAAKNKSVSSASSSPVTRILSSCSSSPKQPSSQQHRLSRRDSTTQFQFNNNNVTTRQIQRASSTVGAAANSNIADIHSTTNERRGNNNSGCMPSARNAIKRSVSFLEPLRLSRAGAGTSAGGEAKQPKQMLWSGVLSCDMATVRIALLRLLRREDPLLSSTLLLSDDVASEQRDGFTLADMALLSGQPAILQILLENGAKFSENIQSYAEVETQLVRLVDDAYQKYLYFSRLHETKLEMRGWKPSDEDEQTRIQHWKLRHEYFSSLLANFQRMRQPQAPSIAGAIATSPFSIEITIDLPKLQPPPKVPPSAPVSIFTTIVVEVAHSPSFGAASQSAIVARTETFWNGRTSQTFAIGELPEESRYFVRVACGNPRAMSSWCYMFDAVSTVPWCGSAHDYVNLIPSRPWPDWKAFKFAIDDTAQRLKILQTNRNVRILQLGTCVGGGDVNSNRGKTANGKKLKRRPSFSDNVRSLFGVHPIQTSDVVNAHSGLFIVSLVVSACGKRVLLAAKHAPPAIMVDGTSDEDVPTTNPTTTGDSSSATSATTTSFAYTTMAPTTLHILNLLALSKWKQTRDLYRSFSNICNNDSNSGCNSPTSFADNNNNKQQHQQQQDLPLSIVFRRNLLQAVCTLQTMMEMDDLGMVHHQLLSIGHNHGAYAVVLIKQLSDGVNKKDGDYFTTKSGVINNNNNINNAAPFFARFRNFEFCTNSVQQLLRITNVFSTSTCNSIFSHDDKSATTATCNYNSNNKEADNLFESGADDFVHIVTAANRTWNNNMSSLSHGQHVDKNNLSATNHHSHQRSSSERPAAASLSTTLPVPLDDDDVDAATRLRSASWSSVAATALNANKMPPKNFKTTHRQPPEGLCLYYFDAYIDGANVVLRSDSDQTKISDADNDNQQQHNRSCCHHKGSLGADRDGNNNSSFPPPTGQQISTPTLPYVQIRSNAYVNENDWRELCQLFSANHLAPPSSSPSSSKQQMCAKNSTGTTTSSAASFLTDDSSIDRQHRPECYTTLQVEFLDALRQLLAINKQQKYSSSLSSTDAANEQQHESRLAVYMFAPLLLSDKCTAIVVAPARQQVPYLSAPLSSSSLLSPSGRNPMDNARFIPLQLMQLSMQVAAQPDLMHKWAALLLELETLSCIGRYQLRRLYRLDADADRDAKMYLRGVEELRIALLHATQASANFLTHLLASMRQQQLQSYSQQLRRYNNNSISRYNNTSLPPDEQQQPQYWQILPFMPK